MTLYNGQTPATVHRAVNTNVYQNQTLSYANRVVEHENDEGKVTAYIMQTQIWAHNPPDHNGNRGNPMLVQDWTDVPRVRMPANPAPAAFSKTTAQRLTSIGIGSAGSWDANQTGFVKQYDASYKPVSESVSESVSEYMKDMAEMLEEDEYPNGVQKP